MSRKTEKQLLDEFDMVVQAHAKAKDRRETADYLGEDLPDFPPDPPGYDEYVAREMKKARAEERLLRAAAKAEGKVKCRKCGYYTYPGKIHYPAGDPESGPAHPAQKAKG